MNMDPKKRRQGLTLIEVVIALAILGVGLTAMIETASRCLAVIKRARYYETARHLLSRAEAEEPLQIEDEVEEGTESGDFKGGPYGYKWIREIKVVGEEEDGLFEVRWAVTWNENNRESSEEVVTYLYAPQKKGGTVESTR
ncbi:MAG: prepilin-type N-terminal cleavage/methylation domain-containing protein [Lentisphaerota bacterium]